MVYVNLHGLAGITSSSPGDSYQGNNMAGHYPLVERAVYHEHKKYPLPKSDKVENDPGIK